MKAISINPVDYKVRQTERVLNFIYDEQRPEIIGWDISGNVVSKGKR